MRALFSRHPHLQGEQATLLLHPDPLLVLIFDVATSFVEDDPTPAAHNLRNAEQWFINTCDIGRQLLFKAFIGDGLECFLAFVKDKAPIGELVPVSYTHLTLPTILRV